MAQLKTLLLVAATLLISLPPTIAGGGQQADVSLKIALLEGEHGKDSNSSTTLITVNGNRLTYQKKYAGYASGRMTPIDKTISLKAEEVARIKQLLKDNGLLTSQSLERPTDEHGRYFSLNLQVELGKRKSLVKVSGMTNSLEGNKPYDRATAFLEEVEVMFARHQ